MENEIVRHDELALDAVSTASVVKQVALIQEIMKVVMKDGEHFGLIPGCGPKPSLLKPGAEKLGFTFRLRPEFDVIINDLPGGHREYQVKCTLFHILNGQEYGQGVGSCCTMEGKYRYRNADLVCPECGQATIIKGKAEFGGGWLCYKKKGGCGAKWTDDNNPFGIITAKIEHDNPADHYNTCLKMAKKRAHVDAILTATAASDIFTQDVEDMAGINIKPIPCNKPPIQEPQKKPTEPPQTQEIPDQPIVAPSAEVFTIIENILDVKIRKGENKKTGKPWEKYIITDAQNIEYSTFSRSLAILAKDALDFGVRAELGFSRGKYGNELVTIVLEKPLMCPQDNAIPATTEACDMCSEHKTCPVAKQLRK